MSEEHRRLLLVATTILGLVLVAFAFWRHYEDRRPQLLEVAVVFLPEGEELARPDPPPVKEGVRVWAGALLQFRQGRGPVRYLCPFPHVLWQGQKFAPAPPSAWPKGYGVLKAHWFTVEPAFFGGEDITAESAEKLIYQDFAAAELGNDLKTLVEPEAHNDDFFTEPVKGNTLGGGFWRLKVKVSVYRDPQDLLPWASVSSPGAGQLMKVPALGRFAPVPAGVHPKVSLAFRCPVFTFAPDVWPFGGEGWPLPLSPKELVAGFFVMTPQAVAALAAVGDPLAEPWKSPQTLFLRKDRWLAANGSLTRWGAEVMPGDALTWSGRWAVAWRDDGNGILDGGDEVLVAWMQPPRLLPLHEIGTVTSKLTLLRVKERAP